MNTIDLVRQSARINHVLRTYESQHGQFPLWHETGSSSIYYSQLDTMVERFGAVFDTCPSSFALSELDGGVVNLVVMEYLRCERECVELEGTETRWVASDVVFNAFWIALRERVSQPA